MKVNNNDKIKYTKEPDNRLLEDAIAESVDEHLMSIYNLYAEAHPEWVATTMAIFVNEDGSVTTGFRVLETKGDKDGKEKEGR